MPIFDVDVEVNTHDGLKAGTPHTLHAVAVEAADDVEACLVACQLAARHGMPVSARITI